MKRAQTTLAATTACLLFFLCASPAARAQDPAKAHHTVVEVSLGTPDQWNEALNSVEHLRAAFGPETIEVEVVCHSKGLHLLVAKDTPYAERIKKLADAGVIFAACRNTMHAMNLTKEDLLPECVTVDAGVAEVVRKQEAHWTFLKPSN